MKDEDANMIDGFITITNTMCEALAAINLSEYESRALWAIFRKTIGWNKQSDKISISQFSRITGIDRANLYKAITRLEKKRIINVRRDGGINVYSTNPNVKEWKLETAVVDRNNMVGSDNIVPNNNSRLSTNTTETLCPDTNTTETKQNITIQDTNINNINKTNLQLLVEYYQYLYKKKFGASPLIGEKSWGKYGRLFKAKVGQGVSPKEIALALKAFSASPDSQPSRLGFDLGIFFSDAIFNKMRALSIKKSSDQEAEDKYGKY